MVTWAAIAKVVECGLDLAIALQERNEKFQERLAKEKAEQKAQRLAEILKAMGIDTDEI